MTLTKLLNFATNERENALIALRREDSTDNRLWFKRADADLNQVKAKIRAENPKCEHPRIKHERCLVCGCNIHPKKRGAA